MKTNLLLTIVFVLFALRVSANDKKYIEAMQKQIKAVYEAASMDQLQQAVNALERISNAESKRWEPLYYMAFGHIMMSNQEQDGAKKDQLLDRAMELVTKAKTLAPEESELSSLEGFVYMMKVTIDPQSRGMMYAPKAMQAYEKALKLNPENPRAMALMAQMQYGTSRFFNSPTTEACQLNVTAEEKLKTFRSDNPLAPEWGASIIESLKEKCK